MAEYFEETLASAMELDLTSMPLQDITMSQTLPLMNGGNPAPYGTSSAGAKDGTSMAGLAGWSGGSGGGGVGRTMKEYEDLLGNLQKENFNLKLRIYFLEEQAGISQTDQDVVKKNIELNVEMESMKKELIEKQELLSQAAKAFELIEEQKEATARDQAQRQQLLEKEREKVTRLEKELTEYRERDINASMYYKETFGLTPEQALENTEKLRQMEELVASLEAEVKQISSSLEEERSWAQELENERDQLRERLDVEVRLREKQDTNRMCDIDGLREKVKELEEQLFKKDSTVQQYRNDLVERDRLIKEKSALLLEKCQAYEELNLVSEKRKQQIVQLRASVKTRDDALTDLNYKHRALLSQCENSYGKRSSSSSPSTLNPLTSRLSPSMGQKPSCVRDIMEMDGTYTDLESYKEKSVNLSPLQMVGEDTREVIQLTKELEERDSELKRLEEARKQLVLRLCNTQKYAENTEQRLKKMEGEHEKAIRAIQGFMEREQQMRDANARKERRILELEVELRKLRDSDDTKVRRNEHDLVLLKDLGVRHADGSENSSYKQQRFEEMESNINDLRGEIETIKAEKYLLEKRIQAESEELQERLHDKEQKIEILETEKQTVARELTDKITELDDKLRHAEMNITDDDAPRREELLEQLKVRDVEIEEKNRKIEQLTKELQVKTQNLQKLVNTELWSKNKEIAKLHNHMTASYNSDRSRNKPETVQESGSSQLSSLIRELGEIGIRATFANETARLNYTNGNGTVDMKTLGEYVRRLTSQKNDLEKEVDYLKWLKLVSKPDISMEIDGCDDDSEWAKKYCELLRTHLKDLMKFMKEMLRNAERADTAGTEQKKMLLDVLLNSKMLSDDFVRALDDVSAQDGAIAHDRLENPAKKTRPEDVAEAVKNQASQSDSEAFSEPDRTVSMARIGLQETQHKTPSRSRFSKYTVKTCSDSEDSTDYVPYYKSYQNDLNDLDTSHQIQELKETNNMLYSELSALRNDLVTKISFDCATDEKLTPFITKLEKSQRFCEKLQVSLEKRIHEFHTLKKQNSIRKTQLEKKINDMEQMANEMSKQKSELLQFRESTERKTTDTLLILNKENESLRARIKQLEDETETAKATISTLRKELEHLTLSHSEIFVENSKLTNDKLRLEQEIRKMEGRYDGTVRSLHDKFSKEISDLNQINDSHRARVQELETANKEFRRHIAVCEASDSAPSSSGVSSIPTDTTLKPICDDILQEYQPYNNSQYWQLTNYSTMGARSKSSCSPDLGIESDAAVTTVRPLKETLKITESMTNLLSDEENGNGNHRARDSDSQSPLPIEGLDEVEALKHENELLKRRLMKTKKALEDTFEHLSASNKNKKNVEKAIIKQLMITKNVLKKTRTFEEPLND
ncbi:PREDICTED: centrosomin isoform X2 [Dinoponera quadriceps]|uniref:Centrosomin isoform X2 n=1 Tax=Dinoponera quadriceps TaxID=609295 RepID=A0A6P3XFN6_DINQU|nr:PREDICTED: centrosomin isoform X2 [Dinoponera quadriceps]